MVTPSQLEADETSLASTWLHWTAGAQTWLKTQRGRARAVMSPFYLAEGTCCILNQSARALLG